MNYKDGILSIRDTGIGMNEEHVTKIWERFYRVEKNGSIPGSGIGLSIVEKIANLYDFRVTVTSKIGIGTTFSLEVK